MAEIWMDVDAAVTVPVNIAALIDDTDFKTREESVTYDQAGLDLVWNFVTTTDVITQTAVTPTDTAGVYDWTNVGNAMYKIEIPASGGGTINNDTEGFGYFTGFATGILPWRSPIVGFRAAALNNAFINGGDELDVNVTKVNNTSQTANDNGADINTILSRIIGTLASGTHNPQTGDSYAIINHASYGNSKLVRATTPANTLDIEAGGGAGIDWGNIANKTTVNDLTQTDIQLCDTTTTNTDMVTEPPTAVQNRQEMDNNSTQLTAIVGDTNELQGDWVNGGRLDLLLDAVKAVTDVLPDNGALTAIGTDTARLTAVRAAVLTDWINGGRLDLILDAIKTVTDGLNNFDPTTVQTESYATDGATASVAQLLYMILSIVSEFAISGTTITSKKLDGSTTAMTHTVDSDTSPTSRTRAT